MINQIANHYNLGVSSDNLADLPIVKLNERYFLTESLIGRFLELNDLETFTWRPVSITEIDAIMSVTS